MSANGELGSEWFFNGEPIQIWIPSRAAFQKWSGSLQFPPYFGRNSGNSPVLDCVQLIQLCSSPTVPRHQSWIFDDLRINLRIPFMVMEGRKSLKLRDLCRTGRCPWLPTQKVCAELLLSSFLVAPRYTRCTYKPSRIFCGDFQRPHPVG